MGYSDVIFESIYNLLDGLAYLYNRREDWNIEPTIPIVAEMIRQTNKMKYMKNDEQNQKIIDRTDYSDCARELIENYIDENFQFE